MPAANQPPNSGQRRVRADGHAASRGPVRSIVAIVVLAVAGATAGAIALARRTVDAPTPTVATAPTGTAVELATAAAAIDSALRSLAAQPSVVIEGLRIDPDQTTSSTVRIDSRERSFHSVQTLTAADAATPALTVEQRLIGTTLYIQYREEGAAQTSPFDALDARLEADQMFDGAYLAHGETFDSLDSLGAVVADVPAVAEDLGTREVGGVDALGYRLTFDAHEVATYLAAAGLERVVSEHAEGATSFEFWIADRLVELVATGTQFHDGEAIAGVKLRLTFSATDVSVVAPE